MTCAGTMPPVHDEGHFLNYALTEIFPGGNSREKLFLEIAVKLQRVFN